MKCISFLAIGFACVATVGALDLSDLMVREPVNPDDVMLRRPAGRTRAELDARAKAAAAAAAEAQAKAEAEAKARAEAEAKARAEAEAKAKEEAAKAQAEAEAKARAEAEAKAKEEAAKAHLDNISISLDQIVSNMDRMYAKFENPSIQTQELQQTNSLYIEESF